MDSKSILKGVFHFTHLPAIIELQEELQSYGNLMNKIAKNQPWSSTELLPENKKKFKKILSKQTKLIEKMFLNVDMLAIQSGFTKQVLDSLPQNDEFNGARSLACQFFAMIRNKQKLINKVETLLERRDEIHGFKNHMEKMNNLICKNLALYDKNQEPKIS